MQFGQGLAMFQRNLLPPATGLKCIWLPRWQQKQDQRWENKSSQLKPKKAKRGIKDKDRCRLMVVAWRVGGITLRGMEKETTKWPPLFPCVYCSLCALCVCIHYHLPTTFFHHTWFWLFTPVFFAPTNFSCILHNKPPSLLGSLQPWSYRWCVPPKHK
jgi:hypothetical protein